jgi:hypothetical protein
MSKPTLPELVSQTILSQELPRSGGFVFQTRGFHRYRIHYRQRNRYLLEDMGTLAPPRSEFTLRDVAELHVDAAPQLLSDELKETLKEDYGIRVISAAPKHQHQNGTPERRWQTARQVAFKMMTHARFGLPFFDTALQQAALI